MPCVQDQNKSSIISYVTTTIPREVFCLIISLSWANQKRHCSSNSHRSNILSLSIRILSAELAWNRTQVKASGFACMQESVFNLCEPHIKLHPFPQLLSLSSAPISKCSHPSPLQTLVGSEETAVVSFCCCGPSASCFGPCGYGQKRRSTSTEPFRNRSQKRRSTSTEPFRNRSGTVPTNENKGKTQEIHVGNYVGTM